MTVCNMSIEAGAAPADRARRDDVRLPRGPPARAEGRGLGRGARRLAHAASPTTTPTFDKEVVIDAATLDAARHLGHQPGQVVPIDGACPTPTTFDDPASERERRAALEYMGLDRRHADARRRGRHRVHRLVHQRPHRGPARRRRGRRGPHRSPTGVRTLVVPGSVAVKAQAEAEGLDGSSRSRLRVARAGLLDVPGHEPRQARAGRALRVDVEPQLRGPPGQAAAAPTSSPPPSPPPPPSPATSPPRRPGGGGETDGSRSRIVTGTACRSTAATSTPTRSSRPSGSSGSSAPASSDGLFSAWRDDPRSCSTTGVRRRHDPRRRPNFGTGSSREHAVWALQDYGFRP
jgi:hypothetical protein